MIKTSEKESRKQRPKGLNTVDLLKVASTGLGMGSHHAMQVKKKNIEFSYLEIINQET